MPNLTKYDSTNTGLAIAKIRSQLFLGKIARGILDFYFISYFYLVLVFPLTPMSFCYTIHSIIFGSSKPQMGGVTARRVITSVAHKQIVRYFTFTQTIRKPMRKSIFITPTKYAIPSTIYEPLPFPTFVRRTNLNPTPKGFLYTFSFITSGLDLAKIFTIDLVGAFLRDVELFLTIKTNTSKLVHTSLLNSGVTPSAVSSSARAFCVQFEANYSIFELS